MPLTPSRFASRAAILKGEGHVHSDKWHRCWEKVQGDGKSSSSAAAICTHSIGYGGSINEESRTPGRHASANPKRFKTKEGQRNARARERAARKSAPSYAEVLKRGEWQEEEHPRAQDGKFTSGSDQNAGDAPEEDEPKPKRIETTSSTGSTKRRLTEAQQQMQDQLKAQEEKPVHEVDTPEEGVALILKGENVELKDTKDVHTILSKLGEMAIRAKELGLKAPNFDPCTITVKGTSLFCSEKLKTEDFPNGIPRIEMPQFKSKNPVPGSPADKLPRDAGGEVNATDLFMEHMRQSGVRTMDATMPARKLKASQAEMEGVKVAGMMASPSYDPKKARIIVSRDGYVVDGHHTWAAAVGRDAEDGDLDNDMDMQVVEIDLPMSQIYHLSVAWTRKMGLPQAGVKKWEHVLKFNQNHDARTGRFARGRGIPRRGASDADASEGKSPRASA